MDKNLVNHLEGCIKQSLKDYGKHTYQTKVMDDASEAFIKRLAEDAAESKAELRELFRKSPVWNEDIQALIINGTRTHNPDYCVVRDLAYRMLRPALRRANSYEEAEMIENTIMLFDNPNDSDYEYCKKIAINSVSQLAPKAYAEGKKLSRVFRHLCDALGISDETKGSAFQQMFAQFADELSARKIDFKLYVSINPGHFLTMSNPKDDDRGTCMTSCHSFNYTDYPYNNGCSGYARDKVSFIVFTVADPKNPETLNNRKTTRQVFAYKPGNGLLLQSRLYNTNGGTRGAQEESKIYRDLIQRELSDLEGIENLWKTYKVCNDHENDIIAGDGFGGYHDWEFPEFNAMVSIRNGMDDYKPLTVGTWGLCIKCGTEMSNGLYCGNCKRNKICDDCDCCTDELFLVYDEAGNERYVCRDCFENHYVRCDICGRYHYEDDTHYVDDRDICNECFGEVCSSCDTCGEYHLNENMTVVRDESGTFINECRWCASRRSERRGA